MNTTLDQQSWKQLKKFQVINGWIGPSVCETSRFMLTFQSLAFIVQIIEAPEEEAAVRQHQP